jgi:hypothetical protein
MLALPASDSSGPASGGADRCGSELPPVLTGSRLLPLALKSKAPGEKVPALDPEFFML